MSFANMSGVCRYVYMSVLVLTRFSIRFPFFHTFVFFVYVFTALFSFLYHASFHFYLFVVPCSYLVMSRTGNDASGNPAVLTSGAGEASQVSNANAISDTRVTDIENDCEVSSWSVAEYKTG